MSKILSSVQELFAAVAEHEGKRIFVLFTGAPDEKGQSWCVDCRNADPIVHKALESLPKNSVFLTVLVGDRNTWKNPKNEFRVNTKCRLSSIPTMMEFGTPKRLAEKDLLELDMIKALFEESD